MASIIFGVIFLCLCFVVWFIISYWAIILLVVLIVIMLALLIWFICFTAYKNRLKKVVHASIISREPIIETISEKTGHTRSYGYYYTYHEHYRNKDVITGYKVTFSVVFENCDKDTITCKEDSYTYKKLLEKQ